MRHYLGNVVVVVVTALPNFAITFTTILLLSALGLPGWGAYLIGQVLSVQYSVAFNRKVSTALKIGKYRYRFVKEPQE